MVLFEESSSQMPLLWFSVMLFPPMVLSEEEAR
jgi:hypothetical protein